MANKPPAFRLSTRTREVRLQVGTKRERGRAFYRIKQGQLAREPLCRVCGRMAVAADHILRLRDGGAENDPRNLQSLCKQHHDEKTAGESRQRPQTR